MSIKRYDPRTFLQLGRHKNNEEDCQLWWSGSGVRLHAACTFLTVEAESFCTEHAVWLGVLADGASIARFPLLPGRRSYPLLAGMDISVPHEITILRDTQPAGDEPLPVTLHCLETDGTLESVSPRTRLIEFIGDSLTTGEGCTGPRGAEEWRTAWMCSMCTYAAYTAEALDADKRQISVSGWGAWRSWDNDPAHRLGAVYERLCALIPAGDIPYDFNERKADAVVINLGTNDATALRQAQDHCAAMTSPRISNRQSPPVRQQAMHVPHFCPYRIATVMSDPACTLAAPRIGMRPKRFLLFCKVSGGISCDLFGTECAL